MSKETEMFRNPPAPVGYVYQLKMKPISDDNISFLLHLKNNLDFMNDDEDLDVDLHLFRIMSTDEGSSEEEEGEKNNNKKSPIKKETLNEHDTKKDAASKTVSSKTSPKKKKRQNDRSPKRSTSRPSRSKSIKKDRRYSDSSSDSSYYSSRRSRKHSRSPSPCKIKEEEKKPEHLFGSYHCEVCNITMNSLPTFESHVSGKRHLKALKAKNIVETVARSVPTTEVESKKPQPAAGVIRSRIRVRALIQDLVDIKVTNPCPGLHHVTEIRGFTETSYFCSLCNSPCSANSILPHLNGFKHMLKCLKHYRPEVYERYKYKQKYQIEDAVMNILSGIIEMEGTGRISVEQEKLSMDPNQEESGRISASSRPGPSREYMDFQDYYEETTIPDTSKSGFYCKICESHMNSPEMWENHIRGKRHLTNARKTPGSMPSKIKTIPVKGAHAHLMDLLEEVDCPVVGLDHVRETQNHQTRKDMYQCYLCGACLNTGDIVEHLISQKHRMKFLQEIQHECLEVVKDMDINGSNAFAIVEDVCSTIEAEQGRGDPHVFFSKDFFPPPTA